MFHVLTSPGFFSDRLCRVQQKDEGVFCSKIEEDNEGRLAKVIICISNGSCRKVIRLFIV